MPHSARLNHETRKEISIMTSANENDGATKLAKVIATVGAVGAACGAIVLYVLDFPRTLLTGFEVVSALYQQLLAAPETMTQAQMVVTGLSLLGGGSVLLATGAGLLLGLRTMVAVAGEQEAESPARVAPATGSLGAR
jgi:hypothetical protein